MSDLLGHKESSKIFLILVVCCVSVLGCSPTKLDDSAFLTWVDIRDQGIVKQTLDYSCGPAAMATLLSYYFGTPTTELEILNSFERNSLRWQLPDDWRETGLSMAALAILADDSGLEAVGVAVDIQTLSGLTLPAIVYLEYQGFPHFSVIRGVNSLGAVQLADPSWGNQLLSRAAFEELWPTAENGKGKLLLLRPKESSNIIADNRYFSMSSRNPIIRNRN